MHDTTVLRALALGFAALASCAAEAPVLDSIQLIGGSGIDTVHRVAADGNGHIYVLGTTASADFPATLRLGPSGLFVAKIRMSDWGLVFASVIGAAEPIGLALDPAGNAYVSGRTDRPATFPTTEDALRRQLDGQTSVLFALKLGASDGALVYSTFLTGYVSGGAIAVNSSGEAYIAGIGTRNTVPLTTSRVIGGDGGGGAFLLRLSADGRTLVYGSLLAASVHVSAIALDTRLNVYIAGSVGSTSGLRATPGSAQTEFAGAGDAFVMKVRAAGDVVELATFLGGAGGDGAGFLHVGDDGSIYIAGDCEQGTASGLEKPFPTTADAPFRRFGLFRGFFAKLDGSTAALVFSTYLTDEDNWYTSAAQASAVTSSGVAVAYVVRAGRGFPGLNFFPRGELDAARVITFGVDGRVIGDPWLVPGISPRAMSAAGDEILIAGASGFINAPLPPGLRPIGPANADPERSAFQQADVAVAKYSTSLPATHGIDTDRGYIRVSESIFTLTDPSAGQLELTSPEGAVPFRIYEPMPRGCCSEPRPYTASPLEGTTPAVITIRKTGSGSEPAPLLVASARSREALQMIPITTMSFSVSLQASLTVSLQARESDEPVETNLPVNSRVTDNTTLEELNVGVPFSILPDSVPSWLKVQPLSGTTPATVILRATAGLSPRAIPCRLPRTAGRAEPHARVGDQLPAGSANGAGVGSSELATFQLRCRNRSPRVHVFVRRSGGTQFSHCDLFQQADRNSRVGNRTCHVGARN